MVPFNRKEHVYSSTDFEELLKDTIRFFNGTPVHKLPPPEKFHGTGVYAIYYTGENKYYEEDSKKNRLQYEKPIYIGKAVPRGWRQSRNITENELSSELFGRLNEHFRSLQQVNNLNENDFNCRFIILEGSAIAMISTVEAYLIKLYSPIWNSVLDGFGNHDPGSGRYQQAKSDWDVIHSGRIWATKCQGKANNEEDILENLRKYYAKFEK
jgi:hypothetical protein